ncbi:MAG: hypothetical protein C7M88_06475 [Candidatus Arcticimaribacter sp.]|nr:MAG: hypothetical protein C7M88_06475 [Candidatus Arcticimaribacter sp.]
MHYLRIYFIISLATQVSFAQKVDPPQIDKLITTGQYQRALTLLKSNDNATKETNHKIADIYYRLEEYNQAKVYYKKVLEKGSDYLAKIRLAHISNKSKKYREAIEIYKSLIVEDNENLFVQYNLGKLYLSQRKTEEAIDIFKNLIEKDSTIANYYYQLGLTYGLKKKPYSALDAYLAAFEIDSLNLNTIYKLALTFNAVKIKDSTAIFTEKGLKIEPNHMNLNRLKINHLRREKKYNEAVLILKKQDSIYPKEVYNQEMLGICYFNIDSLKLASIHFKKALRLNPENYKFYTYIGEIELRLENYIKANSNFQIAIAIGKTKLDQEYFGSGMAYLNMGENKNALTFFEKA